MVEEEKKLLSEIKKVDGEIVSTKKKINGFLDQNKSAAGFTSLYQLEKKLELLITHENPSLVEDEINYVIDSMCFRVGATGK